MNTDVHAPIYTLPTGHFALPLSSRRLQTLKSVAYLKGFLPSYPPQLYGSELDETMAISAMEIWNILVNDPVLGRPALVAMAETVVEKSLQDKLPKRTVQELASRLVDESRGVLFEAQQCLMRMINHCENQLSVAPSEAARQVAAHLHCHFGEVGSRQADEIEVLESIRQRAKVSKGRRGPLFNGDHWLAWVSFDYPKVPSKLAERILFTVWAAHKQGIRPWGLNLS